MPALRLDQIYANPIDSILVRPEDEPTEMPAPGFVDTMSAIYQQFPNTGFMAINEITRLRAHLDGVTVPESSVFAKQFEPATGYNVFADPQLQSVAVDRLKLFADSRSPEETAYKIRKQAQEDTANKIIGEAGWPAVGAAFGTMLTDPVGLLLLAAPAAGPAAWGSRTRRVAGMVAAVGAVDVGTEAVLHNTQELRTLEESLLNVGVGAIAGVAFGTLATRMTRAERARIIDAIENDQPVYPEYVSLFHGSPHSFESFSLDKVGSGEGAQAFGHGMYFAEQEAVAASYKDVLSRMARTEGYVYEVRVPKKVMDGMLDWDTPLADQSGSVKTALAKILDEKYGTGFFDKYANAGNDWRDVRNNLFDDLPEAELSKLLKDNGVTGVKYLDQDSRGLKGGTRNVVLFDPSAAEIVRRNGADVAPSNNRSVGAAEVDDFGDLADNTIDTMAARGVARVLGHSPLTRSMLAAENKVRVLAQQLMTLPYQLTKNLKNMPSGGRMGSVEDAVNYSVAAARRKVATDFDAAFVEHGQRLGKDALSRRDFGRELLFALDEGDVSAIPEVAKAARSIRKMFDENMQALRDVGVDEEELKLLNAESYVPHMWDQAQASSRPLALAQKVEKTFLENPKVLEEPKDVKAARTRVGPADDAKDTSAFERSMAAHEEAKKAYADAVAAEREALAKVTSEDTPEADRARFVHRQLAEEVRLAKEDMVDAAEDMVAANELNFASVEKAAAAKVQTRREAREAAKAHNKVKRDLATAKRQLAQAERESAEATKLANESDAARGRQKANDALVEDKTRVNAESRAAAKAAAAAVDANRAAAREKSAALRKAERVVDDLNRKLTELETQLANLDEIESGATPKQLEAKRSKYAREIAALRERGIKASEKHRVLKDEAIATEEELPRLKAASREAEHESAAARRALDEAEAAARADRRVASSLDTAKRRKAKAEREADKLADLIDDLGEGAAAARQFLKDTVKAAKEAKKALAALKADAAAVRKFEKDKLAAATAYRDPAVLAKDVRDAIANITGMFRGNVDLGKVSNPNSLKPRKMPIRLRDYQEFMVTDFDQVMNSYIRSIHPNIEMRRRFGSVTLDNELKDIEEAYKKKIFAATSEKAAQRLEKEAGGRIKDLMRMRDRLLGHVGPRGDSTLGFIRAGKIVRSWNYLRALGGQTASSLTDMSRVIAEHGLVRTGKALATFVANMKMSVADAQRMNIALDMVFDKRAMTMADVADDLSGGRGFMAGTERWTQVAAQKFTKWTLMSAWNTLLKNLTSILEQDAIIRGAQGIDKLSDYARGKLFRSLSEDDLRIVSEQFAKNGDREGILLRAQTDKWDDTPEVQRVKRRFEEAVLRSADIMVMTRGMGDMPLAMDSEAIKTLLQFKTYGITAVNRIMIPYAQGLSHGDLKTYNGAAMALALGAMVGYTKDKIAGNAIETDPKRIVMRAVAWSGLLGWTTDAWDTAAAHGPEVMRDLYFGKYPARDPVETALGPTMGTALEFSSALIGTTKDETSAKALHRWRKLAPWQNMFYLTRLIDGVEGETAEALDLEGATHKSFIDRVTETKPAKAR